MHFDVLNHLFQVLQSQHNLDTTIIIAVMQLLFDNHDAMMQNILFEDSCSKLYAIQNLVFFCLNRWHKPFTVKIAQSTHISISVACTMYSNPVNTLCYKKDHKRLCFIHCIHAHG